MRKALLSLLTIVLVACAVHVTPIINGTVLYAQSLPASLHAQWDIPPANNNIISYKVSLDGGTATVIPVANVTLDNTCNCVKVPITVPSLGNHTLSVISTYQFISTDPNSVQDSAPATVSFTLAAATVVTHAKAVQ